MSADMVDPFAVIENRALAPWELEQIEDKIAQRKFDDHGLIPEVHQIEFEALSDLAQQGNPTAVAALRRVHQRADFGGPLSEPHEPSWSLDPERRMPMRGE